MAQAAGGGNGQNKADTRQDRKFLEIKKAGCKLGPKYPLEVNVRIFPPPLEIGDEEGFTPEKDIFGRKDMGMGLVNLLADVSEPLVLAIDAQWGAGKTTFLKMLAGELRQRQFPVIYFDAFANDYVEDAFMVIAGEIYDLAKSRRRTETGAGEKFKDAAVKVGKVVLRRGAKVALKVATAGILEGADLENLAADAGAEAADAFDQYLGDKISDHSQEKASMTTFREALAGLPALMAQGNDETEARDVAPLPLVIIVDELDRCRPTFALEMLERIKHLFSVENVHFVFGVHIKQLESSVKVTYGPNIEAGMYLQKFINLVFHLADVSSRQHERTTQKYINFLKVVYNLPKESAEIFGEALNMLSMIAEKRQLSLRTIERVTSMIAMALTFTKSNVLRPPPIVAGLCIIKVLEPELFVKAKQGSLTYEDVAARLGLNDPVPESERYSVEFYRNWWRYCCDPDAGDDVIEYFREIKYKYGVQDRLSWTAWIANHVIDGMVLVGR